MAIPPGEEHVHLELGLEVVGKLPPGQAGVVEAHLAACSACRQQADELREVGQLLGRLTPADIEAIVAAQEPSTPSPISSPVTSPPVRRHAPDRPPTRPAKSRRPRLGRTQRLVLSALMLAVIVGADLGVWLISSPSPVTLIGGDTNPVTGVSMSVTVVDNDTGSHLTASMSGLRTGGAYQLYAVSAKGVTQVVNQWTATDPSPTVSADIPLRAEELAFVTVTQSDATVLVTVRVVKSTAGQ